MRESHFVDDIFELSGPKCDTTSAFRVFTDRHCSLFMLNPVIPLVVGAYVWSVVMLHR